jgi:alcohol dehydrogenase class IV
VPTTLSGAEMTGIHRPARGAPEGSGFARPAVVLTDPALAASQPVEELAASALNALGHAVEAPLTPDRNPVSTLAAHEAARLLAAGLPDAGDPDREALALGGLLAGYSIDSATYGLHHILSQTLARVAGAGHGQANAAVLGVSIGALRRRFPDELGALDAALAEAGGTDALAARLFARAGARRLGDLELEGDPGAWAEVAAERPDLARTPPPADREEIEALYRAAL